MGPRLLVVATAALAAEADYEERRRLAKVGVVYLEDDDSTNIQCVEEIYRYSRCLQDSACPATPRCQGAPTNAVDGDCTRWGKLDTLQPGRCGLLLPRELPVRPRNMGGGVQLDGPG